MKYPKVRITIALVLTMLALGACTGEPETLMNDGTIVIQGGTALVGPDLRPLEDAVVVIRDGVIATIGSATDVEVPGGAEVIDATGLTLVPGLIDAHVHIAFASPAEVLRGGVTTVRDLGWPPEKIWPLVEASEDPDFDGPRIVAAGQMLTVDGGYPMAAGWAPPGTGLVVSSPGDAAAAVAAQADAGAVVIKVALNSAVGPSLPRETLGAIVEAASARGLRVTGHVYSLEELDRALDAGMTELAHLLMSTEKIPNQTIARMVAAGMTIVPTLSVRVGADLERAVDNLVRFLGAGGKVVYGTDLGNAGPVPGFDPTEIAAMSAAGMSPHQILVSATSAAAELLGLGDTGILAEGMSADIVALGGHPLQEPDDLTNIAMVWRRGRRAR